MKYLILLFVAITYTLALGCKPIEIERFDAANEDKIEEYNKFHYVTEHYLVHNWWDTDKNRKILEDFMCQNLREDYVDIDFYSISFYKHTSNVNNEYFKESRKLCQIYMVDEYIVFYEFNKGRLTKNYNGENLTFPKVKDLCGKGDEVIK